MIHYKHGVTIVRNTQSRVLWYVYITCVTIIRHCVYCVVAAVTLQLGSSLSLHPQVLHLVHSVRRSVLYSGAPVDSRSTPVAVAVEQA